MMVRSYASSPPRSYILEKSSELLVDTYVAYLVLCRVVRRYPGYLIFPFGSKDATSNDKTIQGTKVGKIIAKRPLGLVPKKVEGEFR